MSFLNVKLKIKSIYLESKKLRKKKLRKVIAKLFIMLIGM